VRVTAIAIVLVVAVWPLHSASAADDTRTPEPNPEDIEFFNKRVRPILLTRCFECHSSTAKKLRGGFKLDSREAALAGGETGAALVPGEPGKSLLIAAVRYDDEQLQMPPSGKLSAREIADLTEWVQRGAPFPAGDAAGAAKRSIDLIEGRKHWAFQPVRTIEPPVVAADDAALRAWPQQRIDHFILAAQRAHGLKPSPAASHATLIRRLKFDLLGLPPTPDEVREFVADESPDAFARLVERYLASPHYGERWGRYWLDLARYCDVPESWREGQAKAWLYRDWVVRAINDDMPYDKFVRMQFAADLLPDFQPADAAALGFLGLSPTYWKELKLDHNVIKQVVAEEWEEQIDAIGSTFLGLTTACARCHDHKFDPITQQDYYGLAGVLASIRLDDRPIITAELATVAAQGRARVKELQQQIDKLEKQKPATDESKQQIEQLKEQITHVHRDTPHIDTPLAFGVIEASLHVLPDGPHRTKLEYKPGEPQNVPMHVRGNPAKPGPVVPRRFLAVLSRDPNATFREGSGRRELAEAIVTNAAPLAARVMVNRVWKHHFGRGLVNTPSNFGTQGDRPSHPELLDDLAAQFIDHGWSLKWLHREIVLSATYQQDSRIADLRLPIADLKKNPVSSEAPPSNRQSEIGNRQSIDPDNVWLWRMPVRRLDVEAWRDAMLLATGELDATVGGAPSDLADASNRRRALYGSVKRRELADILRLHDFPDPVAHSGSRVPTTSPLQQLFVLNSPFLQHRSEALVRRLQTEAGNDIKPRIRRAHWLLFGREASADQIQWGQQFLNSAQADGTSADACWRQYAQALLASNELMFVD
jgi:mono/diheme cytochrome c family protein